MLKFIGHYPLKKQAAGQEFILIEAEVFPSFFTKKIFKQALTQQLRSISTDEIVNFLFLTSYPTHTKGYYNIL